MIIDAANNIAIQGFLSLIEREHGVEILFAVESGSRAWGFESPDSDYDVRFVYRRPLAWYLSVHERRDVIEPKFPEPYDINGWDIKKALFQIGRGNPAFYEWLHSPHNYMLAKDERAYTLDDMRNMSKSYFNSRTAIYHYLHMASGNYRQYIYNQDSPILKKYLYVVRPLVCCEWIAAHNDQPPQDFATVLKESEMPKAALADVQTILSKKKAGVELGRDTHMPALDMWIEDTMAKFGRFGTTTSKRTLPTDQLDEFLYNIVRE